MEPFGSPPSQDINLPAGPVLLNWQELQAKSSPVIMMLLSGGALRAEKRRKPKGRLGTSRSLSSPYTPRSHNTLTAFSIESQAFFAPQTRRGKKVSKLLFLTLNLIQRLIPDTAVPWSQGERGFAVQTPEHGSLLSPQCKESFPTVGDRELFHPAS